MNPVELSFNHIWDQLIKTGATHRPSDPKWPNVMILQMAKVASTSISSVLCRFGINALHCHGVSATRQERDLSRLRRADLTVDLVSHRLPQHMRYVCLHMLVRWYQRHKRHHGHKLKVITLTRDPVNRYASNLMQHRSVARSQIISWQRARLGRDVKTSIEETQAIHDFVVELASIIVAAHASKGVEACLACEALARERWPQHFIVEDEMSEWLRPLIWFETEIESVFGLDVLATSELRERGCLETHNDWAEILVLRFENLATLGPEIGRFVGVKDLTLPYTNVTKDKPGVDEVMAAVKAALDTELGRACARELRASRYAQACGYDFQDQT